MNGSHSHSHSHSHDDDLGEVTHPAMHTNNGRRAPPAAHNLDVMPPLWLSFFNRSATAESQSQGDTNRIGSYPFTLATVDETGFPRARTCMFRGFLGNNNSGLLKVTTDRRMAKMDQLTNKPVFEACFYFPASMTQFRFSGTVRMLYLDRSTNKVMLEDRTSTVMEPLQEASNELAEAFNSSWEELSPAMKLSFCKPAPGRQLTDETAELLDTIEQKTSPNADDIKEGQSNFVLLILNPSEVDYVNVKGVGQRLKFVNTEEYVWTFEQFAP
ncbi:pyridoxamine 5'-phosphate oxidase-domain-containing protein [Dipodascopsis uninucleata]